MAAGLYDITSEKLGKGHFAVVKLAKHCLTGELVAIKIIDKLRLKNENLQQLSQEIRLLTRLSEKEHPNIVKLYQVIGTKTKLYLVMEYPGRDVCDLYDFIDKSSSINGLAEKKAQHIFRQICSAISYCHSLRIVHRDLKPENILIVNQPEEILSKNKNKYPLVKLIDFGFSNQWNDGEKLQTSCGSLAYSAPEILLGGEYEADKVDIWGLGCILYVLLFGSNPFEQLNVSETLTKILDCSFKIPNKQNLSFHAIDLIKGLLRKDPESRLTINQVLESNWLLEDNVDNFKNSTEEKLIESDLNIKKIDLGNDNEIVDRKKKIDLAGKNFFPDLKLHENVIELMIKKEMCTSKEQIENAINYSKKIANASKSEILNQLVHLKDESISNHLISSKLDYSNTDNKLINQQLEDNNNPVDKENREHAYLTATYHLLKDKLCRESQGINLTNIIENKLTAQKKILPNKPRISVLKKPQFNSSIANKNLEPANYLSEIHSNENKFDEKIKNLNNINTRQKIFSLSPNEEECSSYLLPLARKCSIVSEEGSCFGNSDYSGNESSIECFSKDKKVFNSESIKNLQKSSSNYTSNNSSKKNSKENLKVLNIGSLSIKITDLSECIVENENNENDEIIENETKNELKNNLLTSTFLHQATSSPDLGREEKKAKCSDIFDTNTQIVEEIKLDNQVIQQLNQYSKNNSSVNTSMRIIIESKSCCNILSDKPENIYQKNHNFCVINQNKIKENQIEKKQSGFIERILQKKVLSNLKKKSFNQPKESLNLKNDFDLKNDCDLKKSKSYKTTCCAIL